MGVHRCNSPLPQILLRFIRLRFQNISRDLDHFHIDISALERRAQHVPKHSQDDRNQEDAQDASDDFCLLPVTLARSMWRLPLAAIAALLSRRRNLFQAVLAFAHQRPGHAKEDTGWPIRLPTSFSLSNASQN